MTYSDEISFDKLADEIETDEQAMDCLPPFPQAIKTYAGYRAEGKTPREAFLLTMALWRQWQESARPAGYAGREDRNGYRSDHRRRHNPD